MSSVGSFVIDGMQSTPSIQTRSGTNFKLIETNLSNKPSQLNEITGLLICQGSQDKRPILFLHGSESGWDTDVGSAQWFNIAIHEPSPRVLYTVQEGHYPHQEDTHTLVPTV